MAQLTEEVFRKHLKSGTFSRVYVIYGAESALVARYASQLEQKAAPTQFPDFNLHHLSGDVGADAIAEAVEALPMMDTRSCVVVYNYDPDAANAAETKKMAQLLGELPDYCTLIFRMASVTMNPKKPAKWKAFLKAAGAAGDVLELPQRSESELVRYITAYAQKNGCAMDAAAARLLIAQCGRDWALLQNELDKLCAWTDGGPIDRAAIEAVACVMPETAAYKRAAALVSGAFDDAYRQLDTLLFQREEPVMLLGAIASAYVDLYRARAAADSGESAMALGPVFDYGRMEFKLRNAARDCQRYTLAQLRRCLDALADADAALKGSRTPSRGVLEKMMAELMQIYGDRSGR